MSQLYRVLYCSRADLGDASDHGVAEIRAILARSRTNNSRDAITGGLIFSDQCFAQVLEGPPALVEAAFERIQCDPRHRDVTVLSAGPIATRDFPDWSMAFAGTAESSGFGRAIAGTAFTGQTQAGEAVLALLRGVVTREDEWLPSETDQ